MDRRAPAAAPRLALLALALALAAPARAQAPASPGDPAEPQRVDLLRSYQLARERDGQLRASRARAEATRELLPQAQSLRRPNVSASYSRGENSQRTRSGVIDRSQRYPSDSFNLTLSQPLYRGQIGPQIQQAEARVQGGEAQLEKDGQDMGTRVVSAYLEALLQRDRLLLIEAQSGSVEAQLRAARLAFEAGTGTRTDIDELQARLDVLAADAIQVAQAIEASRQQLEIFIGQAVAALEGIGDASLAGVLERFDPGELGPWLGRGLQAAPELKVLQSRLETAQAQVEIARAGHRPLVDLVARHSNSSSETVALVGTDIRQTYVGVQVQLPIYAGGRVDSEVRQALASVEEARQTLAYARDDLSLRLKREHQAVREGLARVVALERALRSAEQVVVSNRKGVEAGTRTTLDVLNVEQQRYNTRLDLARARYNLLAAWARLQGLAGGLDEQEVMRINTVLGGGQAWPARSTAAAPAGPGPATPAPAAVPTPEAPSAATAGPGADGPDGGLPSGARPAGGRQGAPQAEGKPAAAPRGEGRPEAVRAEGPRDGALPGAPEASAAADAEEAPPAGS